MKNCLLYFIFTFFLNLSGNNVINGASNHLLPIHEPISDNAFIDGDNLSVDEEDIPNSPSHSHSRPLLGPMLSVALNKMEEKRYHDSHPELFYDTTKQKSSSKIKNLGKILRCGPSVNIERVENLLAEMPQILKKLQDTFSYILRNIKPEADAHIRLTMYKEFIISTERTTNATEPLSVSDLLAVFSNINASIIEAQAIVSQLIQKRLNELSDKINNNNGMQFIRNTFSKEFKDDLLKCINRISNANAILKEFSNEQKDILSFSNLLQDFFLQQQTEHGKEKCTAEDLLIALKGGKE